MHKQTHLRRAYILTHPTGLPGAEHNPCRRKWDAIPSLPKESWYEFYTNVKTQKLVFDDPGSVQ